MVMMMNEFKFQSTNHMKHQVNQWKQGRLHVCNSLMTFTTELFNEPANVSVYPLSRIRLQTYCTNTSKFEHITPILKKLHWLPIKQRIDYKLCLLTYETFQIKQPTYLFNSLSFPSHSLSTRSSDSSVLPISLYVEHLWVKGPFLSLLQDSGTPSHQTPVTRYLFLHSAQNSNPSFQVSLSPWILTHLIIRLPTRIWFLFFLYF